MTNPAGTSAPSTAATFTYTSVVSNAPTVTGLNPTSGPATGGTHVQIFGTGFTGATAIFFGSINAGAFALISPTEIDTAAPAGIAGQTVNVTVTTPGGTSAVSAADQFTYTAVVAAPTVTSVSPNMGSSAGGTVVTISGTGFTGVTQVYFGGLVAASYSVLSPTTIQATTPASPLGTVDVTAITSGGTSATSIADQFTFTTANPGPVITSVIPNFSSFQGNAVSIHGSGFTGATEVVFGTVVYFGFFVISDSEIDMPGPGAMPGTVDVRVITPAGESPITPADQFTFYAQLPAPTVTGVTPNIGSFGGGTVVTLSGTGLSYVTAVDFGAGNSVPFTYNISTGTITVTAPAGPQNTTVDITVTSPGGTSAITPADQYTFDPPTTSGGEDGDHELTPAGHQHQPLDQRHHHQHHHRARSAARDDQGEERESSAGDAARRADLDAFFAAQADF